MKAYSTLRRCLSALAVVGIFAGVLVVLAMTRNTNGDRGLGDRVLADQPGNTGAWPLFGGSLQRNMVNTFEKNIPTEWNVEEGKQKNIKWLAELGSKAYGGPVISGGKVFIGTNNEKPRNPEISGDKGIIMCFRESDGQFLWQAVHDKLPDGRVKDWPKEGICSTPFVEGNRLYYVSNRCEVVCADTDGLSNGNQGVADEKYASKTDADVI